MKITVRELLELLDGNGLVVTEDDNHINKVLKKELSSKFNLDSVIEVP